MIECYIQWLQHGVVLAMSSTHRATMHAIGDDDWSMAHAHASGLLLARVRDFQWLSCHPKQIE
jgi:hypothetical protein